MKKILTVYVVLIACILFYVSYDSYNYINYARISNIKNGISDNMKSLDISILDKQYKDQVVSKILEISNQNDIEFVVNDLLPSTDGSMIYQTFIKAHSNEWIYDSIRLTSGNYIDFVDKHELGYMSSDKNDKNAVGTFSSFDDTYFKFEFEIFRYMNADVHLSQLENDMFSLWLDSENTSLVQKYLNESFDGKVEVFEGQGHGGTEKDIISIYRTDDIYFLMGCSFITIVLIIICMITKQKREILIRRMNGHNCMKIVRDMFLKYLIQAYLMFVATFGLLWIFFIGSVDKFYNEVRIDICEFAFAGFIFIFLVVILAYLYIRFATNIVEVKSNKSLKIMLYINYLLKIVMSIILLMPFMCYLHMSIPQINKYITVTENESLLRSHYSFAFFKGNSKEQNKVFQECIYFNMEEYSYNSDLNYEMSSGMKNPNDDVMKVPLIIVNQNYLKNFQIYNENNELIDLSLLENNTLIVPKEYQNEEFTPKYLFSSDYKVNVKFTGNHINFKTRQNVSSVNNPVILYVNQYDRDKVDFNNMFFRVDKSKDFEYYNNLVSKLTTSSYRLLSSQPDVNNYYVKAQSIFINMAIKIITYVFVYALFVLQYLMLYMQENRKELSLGYMLGKSRVQRYGDMFLIHLCIYLIIMLLALVWKVAPLYMCIEFIIICFVFDSLCMFAFIKWFERKKAVASLKGES